MHTRSIIAAILIAIGTTALPSVAVARGLLLSSTPAEGATASRPRVVTLVFGEPLATPGATASIVMTAMPGVKNHGEMVIRNFTSAWSRENRTLVLSLGQPLRSGTYEVRWQASSADGQRATGTVTFTVE